MIKTIGNVSSLPGLLLFLLKSFYKQSRFIKIHIDPVLKDFQGKTDTHLTKKDLYKIKKYYGFAVPAILGEAFCLLRGQTLSKKERLALSCLGASTGLYDDFFDDSSMSLDHIKSLTINPEETLAENNRELLFIKFYLKALANAPYPELLLKKAKDVFDAQVLSKQQTDANITIENIQSITYQKGGVSLLLYRSVLNYFTPPEEEQLLYALGKIMQLENDIFDVYKDRENGIKTLITTENKIANLRANYIELYNEVAELLQQTSFRKRNKKLFIRYVSLIILRGLVCLDCLEKNELQSDNQFRVEKYSRAQLICDMEKTSNLGKVLRYYVQNNLPYSFG